MRRTDTMLRLADRPLRPSRCRRCPAWWGPGLLLLLQARAQGKAPQDRQRRRPCIEPGDGEAPYACRGASEVLDAPALQLARYVLRLLQNGPG